MAKDLTVVQSHLTKALQGLPDKSEFSDLKATVRSALKKLEKAGKTKKNNDVVTPAQKWQDKIIAGIIDGKPITLAQAQAKIKSLDSLIAAEESKITQKGGNGKNLGTILG